MADLQVLTGGSWESASSIHVRNGEEWVNTGSSHVLTGGVWERMQTIAPDTPAFDDIAGNNPTEFSNIIVSWQPTTGGAVFGYEVVRKVHDNLGGLLSTDSAVVKAADELSHVFPVSEDSYYSFEVKALGADSTESAIATYQLAVGHAAVPKERDIEGWIVNDTFRYPSSEWSATASHTPVSGTSANYALNSSTSQVWIDGTLHRDNIGNYNSQALFNGGKVHWYANHYPYISITPNGGNRKRIRGVWVVWEAGKGDFTYSGIPGFTVRSTGAAEYQLITISPWAQLGSRKSAATQNGLEAGNSWDDGQVVWNSGEFTYLDTATSTGLAIRPWVFSCAQVPGLDADKPYTRGIIERVLMVWDNWGVIGTEDYDDPEEQVNSTW